MYTHFYRHGETNEAIPGDQFDSAARREPVRLVAAVVSYTAAVVVVLIAL